MGIEPTYPGEKYGYIMPKGKEYVSTVLSFKENLDAKSAERYIEQGVLWNSGVFSYRLGRREIWNVVSGSGTVLLDGKTHDVVPGDVIIPAGMKHKISARERMVVVEVQIGEDIIKEDKIKWTEGGDGVS